jgi:hypothetical protein
MTATAFPFWLTAFCDFAPEQYDAARAHWQRLTGWPISEPRGEQEEFVSLLPPDGDDFLRFQRLVDGPSRIHLDLHVEDPRAAAERAVLGGAELIMDGGEQVLCSPGGFLFCYVERPSNRRPAPTRWPDGHTSIVDQVCVDIPADLWDAETAFWSMITGWALRPVGREFTRLDQPPLPVKLLLQRLDDHGGSVRAHLDWATDHRSAEIERQVAAGSELVRRYPQWTVMTGPGGTYCITGRRPSRDGSAQPGGAVLPRTTSSGVGA